MKTYERPQVIEELSIERKLVHANVRIVGNPSHPGCTYCPGTGSPVGS